MLLASKKKFYLPLQIEFYTCYIHYIIYVGFYIEILRAHPYPLFTRREQVLFWFVHPILNCSEHLNQKVFGSEPEKFDSKDFFQWKP